MTDFRAVNRQTVRGVMEEYRAPERYTLHVCADCKQPAHNGDRCPRDRRRIWTQMEGVEYVRADLHQGAVDALLEIAQRDGLAGVIAANALHDLGIADPLLDRFERPNA